MRKTNTISILKPFQRGIILLMVAFLLTACGEASNTDNEPEPYQPVDGDDEGAQTDTPQEQDTPSVNLGNKSGSPCFASCEEGEDLCGVFNTPGDCDGFCFVNEIANYAKCAGLCLVGEGCPDGWFCLTGCPNVIEMTGVCLPESMQVRDWVEATCESTPIADGDEDLTTDTDPDPEIDEYEPDQNSPGCASGAVNCAEGELCDYVTGECGAECNPYLPECDAGEVCHPIGEGPFAGQGRGVCVAQNNYGKDINQLCIGGQLCKRELVCFQEDHCTVVCDPEAEQHGCPPEAGELCVMDDVTGVGVCSKCGPAVPCPEGYSCNESGGCEEVIPCESWEDCDPAATRMTCLGGTCQDGCRITGCENGICNFETGYCQNTCTPACPPGQCCNQGVCGNCCSPACDPTQVCDFDDSCPSADTPCCLDVPDCRDETNPDEYCPGEEICDRSTGRCRLDCPPNGCPDYGYFCSASTGYRCIPTSPSFCLLLLPTCSDPCEYCAAQLNDFMQGQCLPSWNCTNDEGAPIQCVAEGISCGITAQDTPCCPGLICQASTDTGLYTCINPNPSPMDGDADFEEEWLEDGDVDTAEAESDEDESGESTEASETEQAESESETTENTESEALEFEPTEQASE